MENKIIEFNHISTDYISFNEVISTCNISSQTLRKIIRKYNIPFISSGQTYNQYYLKKEDVVKYIKDDTLIDCYELMSYLSVEKINNNKFPASSRRNIMKNIRKDNLLCELLGYRKIEYPLYFNKSPYPQVDVFNKEKVASFFESHIVTKKVMTDLKIQRSNFVTMMKSHNIHNYVFHANHELKFISHEDYNFILEQKKLLTNGASAIYLTNEKYRKLVKSGRYFTKQKVKKILKLSNDIFPQVESEFNLQPEEIVVLDNRNIYFYSKDSINKLVQHQQELIKKLENKYFTINQINEQFNINHPIYVGASQGEIESIKLPAILKGIWDHTPSPVSLLFNRLDVINYVKKYKQDREMASISFDSPYKEFLYKTETVLSITFSDKIIETKNLWYQFVKSKLTKTSQINISSYISQLSKCTKVLTESLSKEIFNYSPNDLNQLFLTDNSDIPLKYKCTIYDFIIEIATLLNQKLNKHKFQIRFLNNPYHFKKGKETDITTYTFEEYQLLYNYSTDLSTHKLNAIKDVESLLNDGKYYHYDSYWVYILTHLTNNWRHSTIVSQIPEITLDNTNIIDLEWLKINDLTIDDANSIIFQIGRKIHKVSKTGAEIKFRIAEPLKIPFATAIAICQLRINSYKFKNILGNNDTGPLLWLSNKRIIHERYQVYKMYFKSFIPSFHFSNRKMNRTLITLIWTVQKSLKVAQVSRGHFTEESTMCYIKLDDQQIHELVSRLFDRESFGYIGQLLTKKLFNYDEIDKNKETKLMQTIYQKFGDIHKIEVTTGLLNLISEQQQDVIKFVNGLSIEETKMIIAKSMTNTLYSRKKYYQCVFSTCKYEKSETVPDCINCPFSIINVYSLSNLMDLYLKQIQLIIDKFDSAKIGEKHKLANHFFLLWRQIQSARDRFGDVVYEFVEDGKQRFDLLAKQLPKTKKYLTTNVNK